MYFILDSKTTLFLKFAEDFESQFQRNVQVGRWSSDSIENVCFMIMATGSKFFERIPTSYEDIKGHSVSQMENSEGPLFSGEPWHGCVT